MVARGPILEFKGEHRFLSSFYDAPEAEFALLPPRVYGSPLGAWLRDMAKPPVCKSREVGFQALKCARRDDALWVLQSEAAAQATGRSASEIAKRRGSARGEDGVRVQMIEGWDASGGRGGLAQAAMLHCARLQFWPEGRMRELLAGTGYRPLVEGNTWGDVTWGAVWEGLRGWSPELRLWARQYDGTDETLRGENWLGRTLMRVRAEIDCEVLL